MNYIVKAFSSLKNKTNESEFNKVMLFLQEYDYMTRYLSKLLKVRPLIIYSYLFKKAFYSYGKGEIEVSFKEISVNFISDMGNELSSTVIQRGLNDLKTLRIVEVLNHAKPGQVNIYKIKKPSEIPQVKEMIGLENNKEKKIIDSKLEDYFTIQKSREKLLNREKYKCFYCLKEISVKDFYLDHIIPQSGGGPNWKSNLICACKSCNSGKRNKDAKQFLLENYRKAFLSQNEYSTQLNQLSNMIKETEDLKKLT